MFDEVRCELPLPIELNLEHENHWFQTKSFDCSLDQYEIRKDGSLWIRLYDTEDRSDPNAEGIERMHGMLTRTNQRWVQLTEFIGEVVFYTTAMSMDFFKKNLTIQQWTLSQFQPSKGWLEFSVYFVKGQLKELHLLKFDKPAIKLNLETTEDRP